MSEWAEILDDEGERSHSRFAPSALKRILTCPRSVALSEAMAAQSTGSGVRRGSVYAAEGSVAHTVAEVWLLGIVHATQIVPGTKVQQDGREITIDQDMHEHGEDYAVYVRGLMAPDSVLFVERTVNLDAVVGADANMYGHLDSAVWTPSASTLDVIDYKYGRGIKVSPLDNVQLKAYGLGALTSLPEIDPDEVRTVRTHVFQPRTPGFSIPDVIPTIDLLMWGADDVAPLVRAIIKDGAIGHEFVSGEHCRFCPALAQCPAMRERATKSAQKAFGGSPVVMAALSDDEVADTIDEAEIVGPYLASVGAEALARVARGHAIPRHKLVAKRARRAWLAVTPDEVADVVGVPVADVLEEPALKSPTQVEKLMPKKARADLKPLYEVKSSGYTLAKSTDPRPAASVASAADIFGEVEQ